MNSETSKNKETSFYIIQNEEKFKLDIEAQNETMILSIKNESQVSQKYSTKLEMKDIIKKNKVFKMYDSISEIIESIKILGQKKLISINEIEEKNICIVEMIYSDAFFKENKISFELIPEEKNKDELIKDLVSTVKKFDIKIKNLEKENESLKNQMNEIRNTLNLLQENIKVESAKKIMDFPSKILLDKKEIDFLLNIFYNRENKKVKIFRKLYCASLDGEEASFFHQNCNGKFNTLVLIETPDKRRFGGFTHEDWKSGNNYDPNTFLFSLDLLKIYPRKKDGYSILFYSHTGPVFGGNDEIHIGDKCLSTKSFSIKNESNNFDFSQIEKPLCNLKNDEKTEIIDYEVYQVIFE